MSKFPPQIERVITIYEFDDSTFDARLEAVGLGRENTRPREIVRVDRDAAYDFVNDVLYPREANGKVS